MKIAFAILIALHGAIHLIGCAKALGLGPASLLVAPISRAVGLLWLFAAVAYVAAAIMLFAWPDRWWVAGSVAIVGSQAAILLDWSDARWGTTVNVVAMVPVALP